MKGTLAIGVALAASIATAPCHSENAANSAPAPQAVTTATTVCQNCHGVNGNSTSPTFPRLNGQQADYVAAQLKGFRSHNRADPHARAYMWGMAATLDDALISEIAKFYAIQTPTQPQSGGALAEEGKKIFDQGVEAQHVPPCAACHGEHGEGNGEIPRLAGQHADYLVKQLEAFRALLRENDVMHANTKEMTDSQIEAVVSYLAND